MGATVILSFVYIGVFGITALFLDNDHYEDLCLRVNSSQTKECTRRTDGTLLCYNHIPEDPKDCTEVVVAMCSIINEDINIDDNFFANADWASVERFSITKTELVNTALNIGPLAFRRMTNLRSLHIHNLRGQTEFFDNSFCGLEKLKDVNFTGSIFLVDEDILQLFSASCSVPNIESLSLSKTKVKDILFNRTLIMLIFSRPLKVLDVQSLQLRIDINNIEENVSMIEELYLQNSELVGGGHLVHRNQTVFPNLTILDLSGTVASFSSIFCLSSRLKIKNQEIDSGIEVFRSIQTLIWDRVCRNTDLSKPKDVYFDNLTINLRFDLKQVFLRDNNVNSINGFFNWPGNNVEHGDLTNNKISYLSPYFISAFKKLKLLVLNRNDLYRMSESHSDEFEVLFQSLPLLDSLQINRNKLVIIPRNTFTKNSQLRVLDLSFNQLTIVNFTITNLKRLLLLDLSGNQIKYSDAITQCVLTDFIRLYNSTKTHIIRADNVLTCSKCDDLDGIQWLVTHQDIFNQFENISCTLESGHTAELTTDVLNNIHDICYRPTRIIIIVIIPAAVFTILISVVIVIVKVIKNRFREKRFKFNEQINIKRWKNWKNGEDTYEFPVFLSYASQDKELAKHIWNKLNMCLQTKIGTGREMVYFSELHMLTGPIMEGIKTALERSTSIMFVITDANAFRESEWCIKEFEIAHEMNRHIFIMVTDDLNLDLLPTEFASIFHKTARIILKRTPRRRISNKKHDKRYNEISNGQQHARNESGVNNMQLSLLAVQGDNPSYEESDYDDQDDSLLSAENEDNNDEGTSLTAARNESQDCPLLDAMGSEHESDARNDAYGFETCIRVASECDTEFVVEGIRFELQTTWENVCAAIVQIH
ncbi:hypothetical protein DPMN_038851 [Dreissena polymorpha]|uniref:TIR domain-containing protein n=1 Tax=Dreissena polymorpha TaxID=45954 RepID=A0A9D4RR48_DREPO|nr:hypothetical protein DPMN_038851 [Dreissena polymorpha]